MTEPQPKKTKKLIAIAVLCALVLGTVVSWQILQSTPQASVPEETQPPQDGLTFQRSASWSEYRPATHLTPNSNWMNDPQRPFFLDGVWHFYYLYNADYPEGNGTEWYHATSTDFIHWKDEGVAIEKYKNGLGDIWTGSAVVDTENTAGFGKNAVVSLVTQQVDGVQRQSLFYSTDGGYSFTSYEGNPVMDNPGVEAWRDPKIVWDKERNQWLMLLAEGSKVGFYTSSNLKSWNYQSGFETTGLGIVECPDLFQISVDGDPERTTWVLGISANGAESGRTTGYTYWTGSFDGKNFSADQNDPRWLDAGSDFYAAVTWDDPQAQDQLTHRYAMGWMNNWAYAGELPLSDWSGGTMSTVRQLSLRDVDGQAQLFSEPIPALNELEGQPETSDPQSVTADQSASLGKATSDAYRLHIYLSQDKNAPSEETLVELNDAHGAKVTVGYNFNEQKLFLNRGEDKIAGSMPDLYREIRSEQLPVHDGQLTLDIVVDTTSVEVFAQDGEVSLSSTAFLTPGGHEVTLKSLGGTTDVRESQTTPLAVAETQRQ